MNLILLLQYSVLINELALCFESNKRFGVVSDIIWENCRLGFIFRESDQSEQLLLVMGDFHNNTRTHHIHVVKYSGKQWNHYIVFRDYLNGNEELAKEYETLKIELAQKYPDDRVSYTEGKKEFISRITTGFF